MTIETALDALRPYHSKVPMAALDFIRSHWNEAEPLLLAELDRRIADPLESEQSALFLYALFLCAELRCEAAFERFLRILRLPNLLLDSLVGDILTENMQAMLARTCGTRIEPLKALIEDETVNEFARSAALRALQDLVAAGALEREEMAEYCTELLSQRLERYPSYAWDAAVSMAENLHITEALPLIEAAFQKGLADPGVQSYKEIEKALSSPQKAENSSALTAKAVNFDSVLEMGFFVRNWSKETNRRQADPAELLAEPRAHRLQQFLPKISKVGRNEPCPCGSGKKYKKCCIDTKNVPAQMAALPDVAQLTLADEWVDAGYYYIEEHWPHQALACWWNAWQEVKRILPESIYDPRRDECDHLFTSCDFFSNWLQDYQDLIAENMMHDPICAQNGLLFCQEVAQRFPEMTQMAKNNLAELTAHLLLSLGDPVPALSLLDQMIEHQPHTAQGYVIMAELLSLDAQRFNLHSDFDRARQLLRQALEKATDCEAWDVAVRLEDLTEMVNLSKAGET